jgi:hypothetical protein
MLFRYLHMKGAPSSKIGHISQYSPKNSPPKLRLHGAVRIKKMDFMGGKKNSCLPGRGNLGGKQKPLIPPGKPGSSFQVLHSSLQHGSPSQSIPDLRRGVTVPEPGGLQKSHIPPLSNKKHLICECPDILHRMSDIENRNSRLSL